MNLLKRKLKKKELKNQIQNDFVPRELRIQMPLNSFKYYSIEVNWFSRMTSKNPEISKNPHKFLNQIESVSESKNEISWLVIMK